MNIRLIPVVACLVLTGCATQPRMTETQSGRPEVTIQSSDIPRIKAAIVGNMVNAGYTVDRDSQFSLDISRPTNLAENMAISISIGNAYSSNRRAITFTLVPVNSNSTRVIAMAKLVAQMPGGQTNALDLQDNNAFNLYEAWLLNLKKSIETGSPTNW